MSPEFSDAFSSGGSGYRGTCHCGREFYDTSHNHWDWEEGEYEELERRAIEEPDKVLASNGAVGTIEINGLIVV